MFMPNCGCCLPCTIYVDTFDVDVSGFTQVSGSWSVSGGLLVKTGAGLLVCNTTPADGADDAVIITVDPRATSGNPATSRIVFSYVDSANYGFLEINISSGTDYLRFGWRRSFFGGGGGCYGIDRDGCFFP